MSRWSSTEEFLIDAKTIHGDLYGYSKMKYVDTETKLEIICLIHGSFFQNPYHHIRGQGCPICSGNVKRTLEVFIKKAMQIHGDKYDYSKAVYFNHHTKLVIICPEHGEFSKSPSNHLKKIKPQGCPVCGLRKRNQDQTLSAETFIERANEAHNNKYDYSKVQYTNTHTKVTIICPDHGEFKQRAGNHLPPGLNGCVICNRKRGHDAMRLSKEEFIKRANDAHSNKYDYSALVYESYHKPVTIICPEHGPFPQAPGSHLNSSSPRGCPRCYNKSEGRIAIYLESKHIVHRRFYIEKKEFDYYLPDFNLLIERDGEQHYGDNRTSKFFGNQEANDKFKTKLAKKHGYKITRIPFWLTEEEEHKEIENILAGKPTYPDVPDVKQATTKPKPK
jgi:very-short-patch-repair endonuclease